MAAAETGTTPVDLHDFFGAAGSVTGALIGLLFVAVSVSNARTDERRPKHPSAYRIRAAGTLTALINALAVSLFALIPGDALAWVAMVTAVAGLTFIPASALVLVRAHLPRPRRRYASDVLFMLGLTVTFVLQLRAGLQADAAVSDENPARQIAILVVVCCLIGISRAWQLVGGPSVGLIGELTDLARRPHSRDRPSS